MSASSSTAVPHTHTKDQRLPPEEMEALAFRYANAKNATNADEALSVCDDAFVFEVATGRTVRIEGRDQVRRHLAEIWAAIPDLRTVVEWTVAGADRLVAVGKLTGTLTGSYFGVPPTGRRFEVSLISILEFHRGRIVSESNHVDMLSLFTQVGILTLPSTNV